MKSYYWFTSLSKIVALICIVSIVMPLLFMVLFSFSKNIEAIPTEYTFKWYMYNLDSIANSMLNTFIISISAVLIGLLVTLPLCYALARTHFLGKRIVDRLTILPQLIPGTVLGLSLLQLVNTGSFERISPIITLIFVHVVIVIPVISRPIIAALEETGTTFEEAAKTLGASPVRTFITITLPIISPSMLVGMIFGFARSITDFIITLYLVPPGFIPMSIQIYNSTQYSIPQITSANATILLVVSLIVVSIAEKYVRKTNLES